MKGAQVVGLNVSAVHTTVTTAGDAAPKNSPADLTPESLPVTKRWRNVPCMNWTFFMEHSTMMIFPSDSDFPIDVPGMLRELAPCSHVKGRRVECLNI